MSVQVSRSPAVLAAILLLPAGCENPYPATLTGTYALESASEAAWTNGTTLTPPAVTGVLRLEQSQYGIDWAYGNARMMITGTNWSGSYSNSPDGGLLMTLERITFEGEYDRDGDVLTTRLSAQLSETGPSPVGTLVWRRQKDPES